MTDPEFQRIMNEDPELVRLMNEPDKPAATLNLETLLFTGSGVLIDSAGYPPPTLGVWAMLKLIENPFAVGGNPEAIDLLAALYIIKHRAKAMRPLLPLLHCQCPSVSVSESSCSCSFRLAQARANFEITVLNWASTLNLNFERAVADLHIYLTACFSGFELLPSHQTDPDPDEPKKKRRFSIFSTRKDSRLSPPGSVRSIRLRPRSTFSGGSL